MSGPPREAEQFLARVEVARSELAEIDQTEIDDGEAARRVELQLESLASALLDMIMADKLTQGAPEPTDVFGWLVAEKLLNEEVTNYIDQITEVAAGARYGEETPDEEIESAEASRQNLLPALSKLLDTW